MTNKRNDAKTIEDEWAEILGDSHPDYSPTHREQESRDDGREAHGHSGDGAIEDNCLDVILDISVNLSLEVGKTRISIRDLLKLKPILYNKTIDKLDSNIWHQTTLVNGTLIAHGEVVVTNDKYGIRLTDVISAAERIQKLK